MPATPLVVFGASNFISDVIDAALALGMAPRCVVLHLPERRGDRDVPLSERLAALAQRGIRIEVESMQEFVPHEGDACVLGPTAPDRRALVEEVRRRFGIAFRSLVHPTAYVSPLASVGEGVFIGANAVVAPGARCDDFSLVNRGASVGHDTELGAYARVQPGATVCGLSRIGVAATIGAGATLVERLRVGDGAYVAAGAVVIEDVAPGTLVAGVPARFVKALSLR